MSANYALRLSVAAVVTSLLLLLVSAETSFASPGAPDTDKHPYVGVLVYDLGNGDVQPYCHITLISSTQAVTSHHCVRTGSQVLFVLDNPVRLPAQLHSGWVRMGGYDFGWSDVDVALVDLDEPIDLSKYASIPAESRTFGPASIFDYVTYIGTKQSIWVAPAINPSGKPLPIASYLQNEPGQVDLDRNLISTPIDYEGSDALWIVMRHQACFGNSGSPLLLRGTDEIIGILHGGSSLAGMCTAGDNARFSRTDNEYALGILTGTLPPPPIPTEYAGFARGAGSTGSLNFWAKIGALSEYTGTVTGLSPAYELAATVQQDGYAAWGIGLPQQFHSVVAVTLDDFTSGNDDLDVLVFGYVSGEPVLLAVSNCFTSDEYLFITKDDVAFLDDPAYIEIVVYGYDVEGSSSDFTLFLAEPGDGRGQGAPIVNPVIAGFHPFVTVVMNWTGLDPSNLMYIGLIEHFNNGIPQEMWKSTIVAVEAE